jgi:ribosomal protein L16/L10AE
VSEAQEDVSQKVTQAAGTPEQTQTPEAAGTQEVSLEESSEVNRKMSLEVPAPEEASLEVSRRMSRKVSLEVRGFPTQEIPQDLTYHWSDEDLTHYLPEDRYLPEDLTY